jgi:imipenem/basic amino acid-specific outer membrane pore
MKLVKMSVAAAMLLGTGAFALENVKTDTSVSVYYGTDNSDYVKDALVGDMGHSMFDQANSYGDAIIKVGVTGDITSNLKFGATAYGVTSLNLEQEVVSNTFTGAHGASVTFDALGQASVAVEDASWLGELYVAGTLGKTTAKVGRMELDTPLAFSEKWSGVANTFEAVVLINQDVPDTTLVGAWVAKGNGVNTLGANGNLLNVTNNTNGVGLGLDGVALDGKFSRFAYNGAYAVGAVNNSFKPLTAQAWYYTLDEVANAYWLQGDIDCSLVKGLKIGAQYALIDQEGMLSDLLTVADPSGVAGDDTKGYALKVGYEGEGFKVSAAYSDVDGDGTLKLANVGTNNLGLAQSKLYTEAWWNYGYVGAPGAVSYNVTAEYNPGFAAFGAYYTDVTIDATNQFVATDMTEVTLTASKSFGNLSTTVAYIYTDADDQNREDGTGNGRAYDAVQLYLTYAF